MARNRKIHTCPNCLPDVKGATFLAEYDYSEDVLVPVWVCSNCGHQLRRSTYNRRIDRVTPSQIQAIDEAMDRALSFYGTCRDRYEIKQAYAERLDNGEIALTIVTSYIDSPEFSLADRRHYLFVGRNGSIYTFESSQGRRTKKVRGWKAFYVST